MCNKRVTLKDISKKLNVSLSTVHKALYGKKGVSENTRKKVLKTADEMNFKINIIASTLKRKTMKIAVVLPEASGEERYFYKDIWNGVNGARESLKDFNVEIIKITFKGTNYKIQRQVLEDVYNKYSTSISGLLTVPWNLSKLNCVIDKFADAGIPVVTVNADAPESKRIACISPPSKKIGMISGELMSKMIESNGKVIIISGNKETTIHTKIVEGFVETMSKELPAIDIIQIIDSDSNNAYKTLKDFLLKFPDIRGIYSNNSRGTLLIGKLVTELNLKRKLKVIGTDIFDESIKFLKEDILQAVIYQNPYMQAYEGIKFLFNYIIKKEITISNGYNQISIVLKNNLEFYTKK
ncbi:MAG: substrate-binding domain-containing protein [Clostridium sp.]|nr:substrate-binding domain-containing protein [Clostridium sp.]